MRTASAFPAFWQFIGIGKSSSSVSRNSALLTGRLVDNTGFVAGETIDKLTDTAPYDLLLSCATARIARVPADAHYPPGKPWRDHPPKDRACPRADRVAHSAWSSHMHHVDRRLEPGQPGLTLHPGWRHPGLLRHPRNRRSAGGAARHCSRCRRSAMPALRARRAGRAPGVGTGNQRSVRRHPRVERTRGRWFRSGPRFIHGDHSGRGLGRRDRPR
jgi:hypothetical protein